MHKKNHFRAEKFHNYFFDQVFFFLIKLTNHLIYFLIVILGTVAKYFSKSFNQNKVFQSYICQQKKKNIRQSHFSRSELSVYPIIDNELIVHRNLNIKSYQNPMQF
ncbi:hypothetical protein SSS_10009 [Sarcoptes scabiei]|nr:hypothetical protein SSS_10009 [Sarcoptes scabiei]